jgi:Rrf2 family protein
MFRISRRLDYGLSLMLALAAEKEDRPLPTAALAEKLSMPLPFMHQIAHSLMQAGLIKATPGPRGGLRLNRTPSEISVLHIIEALEGSIDLNPENKVNKTATNQISVATKMIWDDLQQKLLLQLGSITLEMMVEQAQQWMVYSEAFLPSKN